MTNKPKECQWCRGSGMDEEFLLIGGVRDCWDCQGTGFEAGLKAKEEYENKIKEQMEKEENTLNL